MYIYQWSNNTTDSLLQNLHAGTYSVTVTDANNCVQTLTAEVTDNVCVIVVHDVITPNNDGINDFWVIEGINNYSTNMVQVFDKWGDMVYEKSNYNNDWNGQGKGGVWFAVTPSGNSQQPGELTCPETQYSFGP